MLIKGEDILGVTVIAEKENREVGTVRDVIYDPKQNKVMAFLITLGDILTEAKVIQFEEIKKASKEAVIIKSQSSLKLASKVLNPKSTPQGKDTYMHDTKIINEQGEELGFFKDIYFDSKSGEVSQYDVVQKAKGTQKVPVNKVVTSSQSTTVINDKSSQKSGGIMSKIKNLVE